MEVRFSIGLRKMLDAKRIGPGEFHDRLQKAGVDVTINAVTKWLNGGAIPRPTQLEKIGPMLGLKDYRFLLPPPL